MPAGAKFKKTRDGSEAILKFANPVYGFNMPSDGKGTSYSPFEKAVISGNYTSFHNSTFELDDNVIVEPADDTISSNSLRIWFKEKEERRKYIIIGGVVSLVVLAVIIIGVAAGVTVNKEKNAERERTEAFSSTQSQSISGSMKFTDQIYNTDFKNSNSKIYQDLESKFVAAMDKGMSSSPFKNEYRNTKVEYMQPGSVVVVFTMQFDGVVDNVQQVSDSIVSAVKANKFQALGPVDVDAIILQSGSVLVTTTPKLSSLSSIKPTLAATTATLLKSTTLKSTTPITSLNSRLPSTRSPTHITTRSYTQPAPGCHEITSECRSILLGQTTTNRDSQQQEWLAQRYLPLLNHTNTCYEQASFFICAYIAPECSNTVSGFKLPCRFMCEDFKEQCKESLEGLHLEESLLNCNQYIMHGHTGVAQLDCAARGPTPPPPTTISTTEPNTLEPMCYPIHHTFCSKVSWNTTFLPNFHGQSKLNEAYAYLSFLEALHDSGFSCHEEFHALLCGSLLPKCGPNYERIPPCRSLCQRVQTQCVVMLMQLPVDMLLQCDEFPETNCTGESPDETPVERFCPLGELFTCLNGMCIPVDERCNGIPDCTDGSDEHACLNVTTSCADNQMKCAATGQCMPASWHCDSFNDCGDQSDEQNCVCQDHQRACPTASGSNRCLNISQYCDGFPNCYNASDEANCQGHNCTAEQFQCANGNCRPLRYQCDRDNDCGDNSDEVGCLEKEDCGVNFKCANGTRRWGSISTSCVPHAWTCDMEPDCNDGSDEKNCSSLCDPNPCKHGGTCVADGRGMACECPSGTSGMFCQISDNLGDYSCGNDITVNECKAILAPYHNVTVTSLGDQTELSSFFAAAATKLSTCWSDALLTMCQYALPHCGNTIGLPVFPCKHMCEEMKQRCSRDLQESPFIDEFLQCDHLYDSTYYDVECFSLTPPQIPPGPKLVPEPVCEELAIDACKNLTGFVYNRTSLPNLLNHTTQASVQYIIDLNLYAHYTAPRCHEALMHFACAAYVPPCAADGKSRIPPCRSLCLEVEADCGYWLEHVQWVLPFTCDDFPDSDDPNVCVPLPPKEPTTESCFGDQFECGSGECIHKNLLCDSFPLCADNSDESNETCGVTTCEHDQFKCDDGSCIPLTWHCDTDYDCPYEGSGPSTDETNCNCDPASHFKCGNGAGCVPITQQCDSLIDCQDGSDERQCHTKVCNRTEFKCAHSGQCVPTDWLCDSYADCLDGSDEIDCDYCEQTRAMRCVNGTNVHVDLPCVLFDHVCDGLLDCSDGSDETNCVDCIPNPCTHGGKCLHNTTSNTRFCLCDEGTTGSYCETLINPPSYQCDKNIEITECVSVLAPHYNKTRMDAQSQIDLQSFLLSQRVLNKFANCSPEFGELFLCSSMLAGCQEDGLPILPCKRSCIEFTHQCSEELREASTTIDCNLYPDSIISSNANCILPTSVRTATSAAFASEPHCLENKISWCQQLDGFTHARFPNLLNQSSQAEAQVYASMLINLHTDHPMCHETLQLFACSVLTPPCTPGDFTPILPCKSLCETALQHCTYVLDIIQMPLAYECSALSDTNCVAYNETIDVVDCADDEFACDSGACIKSSRRCDFKLDCPSGDDSDEWGCAVTCPDTFHRCSDNSTCIPRHWFCDKWNDCPSGEDELGCNTTICSVQEYTCEDGSCVLQRVRCDGIDDCADGGDELNCESIVCRSHEFRCNTGTCIPKDWTCNGIGDCPYNGAEDEKGCNYTGSSGVCPMGGFKCTLGYNIHLPSREPCLPSIWLCDGEPDCTDGSDEECVGDCHLSESIKCENGGNCTMVGGESYCECPAEYTGKYCSLMNLPEYKCDNPIQIQKCADYLLYNTTSTSPSVQNLLSNSTQSLLSRLGGCYSEAELFVCASRFPTCQANGFPLFPCREVCRVFKSHCGHQLTLDGEKDLLNLDCDVYGEALNENFVCLTDSLTMPTLTSTIARNSSERSCQHLENSFCATLGYTETSLPNFLNQTTQAEANYFISQVENMHTSFKCREMMHAVACSVFYPNCTSNGPLPPCQKLCQAAIDECSYWLNHYSLKLPIICTEFPDSDDSAVCMNVTVPGNTPVISYCVNDTRQCSRSGECVSGSDWCNFRCDCSDCSDEKDCVNVQCQEEQFTCADGSGCIAETWQCDGHFDCIDRSDEIDCEMECVEHEFSCPASNVSLAHCISSDWVCDGVADCRGSDADEQNCNCVLSNKFSCDNKCINMDWVCDGYTDCVVDGADEANCTGTVLIH